MKLISAVVRPERLPQVKAALFRAGVTGITISRVSGHGGEHEMLEHYRGRTVVLEFREKVRLELPSPKRHGGRLAENDRRRDFRRVGVRQRAHLGKVEAELFHLG